MKTFRNCSLLAALFSLLALSASAWEAPLVRVASVDVVNVTNVIHAVTATTQARISFPFTVAAGETVEVKMTYADGTYIFGTGDSGGKYLSSGQAGIAAGRTCVIRGVDGGRYYVDGVEKKNCTLSAGTSNFTVGSYQSGAATGAYLLTAEIHYVRKLSGGEVVANFVPTTAGLRDTVSGAYATVEAGTAAFMVLEGVE